MPSEWTNIGGIADGMLADYEVLNNLMNNQTYLKERAVGVTVNKNPTGLAYNETNIAGGGIRFISGVIPFNLSAAQSSVSPTIGISSTTRPLVFVTVNEETNATASVFKAATNQIGFTIKKTGTGTAAGYISYLAIITDA
jgi:hypothetical protein